MGKDLCIGLDFGTDSVRAVLVDSLDGTILGTSTSEYPRWKKGLFCDPTKYQVKNQLPSTQISTIPGGISFENFELKEPFKQISILIFGVNTLTPEDFVDSITSQTGHSD